MAVLHRALLTWFLTLIFLILLVIRLEERTTWSWFIVFIPMWIFDGSVIGYAVFYAASRLRSRPLQLCVPFMTEKLGFLIGVVLKLIFQLLLCSHIEFRDSGIKLIHVFVPFWLILAIILFRVGKHLYSQATDTSSEPNFRNFRRKAESRSVID